MIKSQLSKINGYNKSALPQHLHVYQKIIMDDRLSSQKN